MFGLFKKKTEDKQLKEEIKDSFNQVKKDFNHLAGWIEHLNTQEKANTEAIGSIKENLLDLQKEILELKRATTFLNPAQNIAKNEHQQTNATKQALPVDVQATNQTAVQTDNLSNLTLMERALIWALLNSEMHLSYEDLSVALGKEKSTIRGQINSIRQKMPGILSEIRENNGKKRVFISKEGKERLTKTIKVKINQKKD